MRVQFESVLIELVQGDITRERVDAVVNAANAQLAGGGGVDGAIHAAAGPELMLETNRRYPNGCPTGQAVATSAGKLAVKYIFHTVGPVWRGGGQHEAELLAGCYQSCLELARDFDCNSIAFPAISTGVYGYPMDQAASVALSTVAAKSVKHPSLESVRFVLFNEGAYGAFARVLESMKR